MFISGHYSTLTTYIYKDRLTDISIDIDIYIYMLCVCVYVISDVI